MDVRTHSPKISAKHLHLQDAEVFDWKATSHFVSGLAKKVTTLVVGRNMVQTQTVTTTQELMELRARYGEEGSGQTQPGSQTSQ